MSSASFRRFSIFLISIVLLGLFVPGVLAHTSNGFEFQQTATPAPTPTGEFEITGTLESISGGFIVVSGQTIDITGAEINDALVPGARVKVHLSLVNGQFIAREVENDDDDDNDDDNGNLNGNTNSNDNSNANQNGNANANANSNGNDNVNATPTVTLQQAIAAVLGVFPNAAIRSVELETRFGGTLIWDIEISNGTELTVDALNGAILNIEQPGDDDNVNGNNNDNNDDDDDDNLNGNGNANGNDNSNSNANLNGNSNDDHGGDDHDNDNSGHGSDDDHDADNSGHGSDDDHDDDNSGRGSDDDDD